MAGYTNVQVLDRVEAKIEATRGTAETTMTRPIVFPVGKGSWTLEQDDGIVAETLRSYDAEAADASSVGIGVARINLEFVMTYEEVIWWWQLGLKGGTLTGVTTGSTPPGYTYAITPTSATDDLASATLKCGDGSIAYIFDRALCNTMTMRWNPMPGGDVYWMMAVELWARFKGTTTFDAPAAVTRHRIAAKGTKVYIDTTTIGTTQALAVIRSGSVTVNNNLEEKQFTENDTYMADDVGRGMRQVSFDLVREMASDTELALLRAGTTRKIRIEKTGDNIGATPTTNYLLRLDMPAARYTPRMAPNWQGQNRIITTSGRALRDASNASPLISTSVIAAATVTA
jgi:hypothetical protein